MAGVARRVLDPRLGGLELSAPHEPAVMAIVEDEYVTGAGYAAVSDQVASSQTAMLRRGPVRTVNVE